MTLAARGLSYAYLPGRPVLQAVSFALVPGEVVFLLGANGSGKTTLIECLGGLRVPAEGEVVLDGRPVRSCSAAVRARSIGYVPQLHQLAFGFSVWEVVLMGRAPHVGWLSRPGRADRAAATDALRTLGLWDLAGRTFPTLSGGEQRLVLIARGLAQRVRYLLLDEPDAHLDPANQHRLLAAAQGLARAGIGVVVTTHNSNNALLYADRVMVLAGGRSLADGAPAAVLTPEVLSAAYGIPFEVVGDGQGPRAFLPRLGDHRARSLTSSEAESASGSARPHSPSSRASSAATANGA